MRFDIENQLSVAQAFTGIAVTTHSYQKQSASQDLSIGRRVSLWVLPTVAASCTTVLIEAIQATDAALTAGIDVLSTVTVTAAQLALGKEVELQFPNGSMTKQYLGGRITPVGGAATLTADVYIVPSDEIAKNPYFAKAVDAAV